MQTSPTVDLSRLQPQAKELLLELLEIDSVTQREECLRKRCAGNDALRREVQALLAYEHQVQSFLEPQEHPLWAATDVAVPVAGSSPVGSDDDKSRMIGPYKLLERIGEGSFGTVYMAEQVAPVKRKVALKIVKAGMDSREVVARFEAERQALALMDHPNIARVLDGGTTAPVDGIHGARPYFVMELVRGLSITSCCDELHLSTRERLELFIDVCRAVQHAHQKGIIHRDLKPSNVLVSQVDGRPAAKVIDFGVAKAIGQQLTDRTLYTGYGQLVGTPLYMSPEQAALSGVDVDTRSDVYSLGVMLYELLTGTTPFTRESLSNASFDELRRIIREEDPPRPSTRLTTLDAQARSTIADRRQLDERKMSNELKGELDWIVMRALEKDRNRRYESASALAADIERFLKGEAVQASPPSVLYGFRKFARKHRTAIATSSLLVVSLILGLVLTTLESLRASAAEVTANAKAEEAAASEAKAKAAEEKALATAASEAALRKQAERNFESALDAVDRMIANAVDPELDGVERIGTLRQKMLHDAIAFYDRLPVDSSVSPQVQHRVADTWRRLGWNCRMVDDYEQSRQAYAKAIKILQGFANDLANDSANVALLAQCHQALGWLFLHSTREHELAKDAFRESTELYVEARRRDPNNSRHQRALATSFKGLGMAFAELGKTEQSAAAFARTIELLESCESATGADLGDAIHELARFKLKTAPEEADELFFRAIKVYRDFEVSGKMPETFRKQLATILFMTAEAIAPRHPNEAQKLWDESNGHWKAINGTVPRQRLLGAQHVKALRSQAIHLRSLASSAATAELKAIQRRKAEALDEEVLTRTRQLVTSFAMPEDRELLCRCLGEQAAYRLERSPAAGEKGKAQRSQADAQLTEAIQICRALVAESPAPSRFQLLLTELETLQARHFPQATADSRPHTVGSRPEE